MQNSAKIQQKSVLPVNPTEPGLPLNLRRFVLFRSRLSAVAAAAAAGLLLTLAFPPVEASFVAWFGLLPLLLLPVTRRPARALFLGWCFGAAHFATSLLWLNEVGFGAGIWLGLFCGIFPAVWYLLFSLLVRELTPRKIIAVDPAAAVAPPHFCMLPQFHQAWLTLALPAAWVGLEWLRSWLFTGFPWNQLGISQWQQLRLLQLTAVTGVYGISFLIICVNIAVAAVVYRWWQRFLTGRRMTSVNLPVAAAAVCFIAPLWCFLRAPAAGAPDVKLRIAGVQGNIPQSRVWSEESLRLSLDVYTNLSQAAAHAAGPELIVWPEAAIPAPLRWNAEYLETMHRLIPTLSTPLLIGAIDYRDRPLRFPERINPGTGLDYENSITLNSAFLIGRTGLIENVYDKIHIVPFGEYTPFEKYLPWLTDLIGMGRSLTAGTEFNLFKLPQEVLAGVNICYEDVFPEISREFTRRGAELLITLTNDAWYAESAGSRQHMIHTVFRAVENRRPMFRAGNNSDTCLILPDGRVQGLLYDKTNGNRFVRGTRIYEIPVQRNQPLTFYTRHGNVFAVICSVILLLLTARLAWLALARKHALLRAVAPDLK